MFSFLNTRLHVCCSNCPFSNGVNHKVNPAKHRCMKTGEWHLPDYYCGKLEIRYVEDDNKNKD